MQPDSSEWPPVKVQDTTGKQAQTNIQEVLFKQKKFIHLFIFKQGIALDDLYRSCGSLT